MTRPDLIAGPYVPPVVRRGDWLDDAEHGRVQVGGYTAAPIAWPRRLKSGRPSLILCGDLIRAVQTESVEAIRHHWGVGATTVWHWRQVLGVPRLNPGSERIARRGVPAAAAARGRAKSATPELRAKMAETKRGQPAHPIVRQSLLKAAQAPKPPGWGQRANAWMLAGKLQSSKRNQ